MKQKIIYIFVTALLFIGNTNAQLSCEVIMDVELNANSEGLVSVSDLITDVDFFLANGTLTYFMMPYQSGVITSGDDAIQLNCSNVGSHLFLVEYTVDGELLQSCWSKLNVSDPTNSCSGSTYCGQNDLECNKAYGGHSFFGLPENPIPAENFAICSSSVECDGEYKVAIGSISNAMTLTYSESLSPDDITEYITPVVLSYLKDGILTYDHSKIYVWENLDCFIVPENSKTIEMDATAETTIVPSMFLHEDNTCTEITIAVTDLNSDVPTDFYESVTLNCDDLGYHAIHLKDAETGMIVRSQLFLADPLETCGSLVGPGDKLMIMANDPPLGTYANTKVSVNGIDLMSSNSGKGWIINEDMLVDGTNTLEFDSGLFSLNGISTLDIVRLLNIIIMDEYDNPMQSIVMDVDGSGYNGIGDLLLTRKIVLGQPYSQDINNVLFKSPDLQFPSDFSPFNFDYDFTKYTFEKDDFENLSFQFEAYKVGDFTGNAVTEEGFKSEEISSTRGLDAFEVTDMEVVAGVPFNFSLKYDVGVPIKGLLAALVSNGVKFQALTSQINEQEVQYNVLEDTEIRISYVSLDPNESIEKISFEITAISNNSGTLIDLLALKSGFPQEVLNENDEVIVIENLEESISTSTADVILSEDISIFPNPVNQKLILSIPKGSLGKMEILDPMGKTVLRKYSELNKTQIDVSDLAKGIYYIKIENNENILNKSFIKI